jgi:uncharacterized membrane protein
VWLAYEKATNEHFICPTCLLNWFCKLADFCVSWIKFGG